MADILRTLAHELVHHMQNLDDRLTDNSGDDGSPEENEANALAAVIMRQYGRENSHIYE
jgi:Zn-dependent peptidase ImmA (M78 family)